VSAALLTHAFVSSDHQDRGVRTRRSGDHIFQKLFMTWCVNDGVATSRRPKRDLSRVDRNVLLLLFEQRIEQERKFKFHPLSRAGLLYFIDFPFWKRASVVQNPANERGLAMINMAHENNLKFLVVVRHKNPRARSFCIALRS
jgi:hypothetical protein